MKVVGKEGGAMVGRVVGTCVGPLAGDGLDEAFGFAIGQWAVRPGKAMFEAQLCASLGEELGAVSGTAICEHALNGDAMSVVKGDGLLERAEDAGSLFVGAEAGEGESGMIVDGDVEAFDAGVAIAHRAIAKRTLIVHVTNNTDAATPVQLTVAGASVAAPSRQRTSATEDAATLGPLAATPTGYADTLPARSLTTFQFEVK